MSVQCIDRLKTGKNCANTMLCSRFAVEFLPAASTMRNCFIAEATSHLTSLQVSKCPFNSFRDSQRTYGRPPNNWKTSRLPYNKRNNRIKCYNCNETSHYAWHRFNPRNIYNKVKSMTNKIVELNAIIVMKLVILLGIALVHETYPTKYDLWQINIENDPTVSCTKSVANLISHVYGK